MTIGSANCSGPVNALIMHNPEDNLASFAGGEAARDTLLKQNQCDVTQFRPLPNDPEEGHCIEYTACMN